MKDNNKTLEEIILKYKDEINDVDNHHVNCANDRESWCSFVECAIKEAYKLGAGQREAEILAALPKIKKPKRFKPGEIMTSDILISIGLYEAIAEIKQIITKQK